MNISYMLAVKGVCNTNCVFCNFYETKGNINEKKHFEELKNEIEELKNKGIKIIKIGVNGYEPTVFLYFFEILDFIKKKGFEINLFTNGVKLSDKEFTRKISKFINSVTITLYSSNDEEHNILTQNKDSYKIKHDAIFNCLENSINVELSILLLRPALSSLNIIFDQISIYFGNKYFCNKIHLLSPNTVMGIDRNKILIPPYTSIVNGINYILEKYLNIFLKYNIQLQLNPVIPKCLFKFNYNDKILLFSEKQVQGYNKKIVTSFNSGRIFFSKCDICEYLNECNGIEQEYINIYGTNEFEKGVSLKNEYTLNGINNSLSNTLDIFENKGIWFDFIYLDKLVKEYEKLFNFPNIILDFYIKDVLIVKSKLRKIRFKNDIIKDVFIINVNKNINGLYKFSLCEGDNNTKIYYFIMIILYKIFNK